MNFKCHQVTPFLFPFANFLLYWLLSSVCPATAQDIHGIELQIQNTREQFSRAASELRDAKLFAAEKLMEYEVALDAYQNIGKTTVNANALDHTQQRLALAELAVESKSARFERIQKRLGELASIRQQLLVAEPQPSATEMIDKTKAVPSIISATTPITKPSPQNSNTHEHFSQPTNPPTLYTAPVLTQHGKLTDSYRVNMELQKLEQHLDAYGSSINNTVKAKVYGTAIEGELALTHLGANQFYARFTAPQGSASLVIGARYDEGYLRSELKIAFSPDESGKEFVLIFDINEVNQPRAIVFEESLALPREMFASHSEF